MWERLTQMCVYKNNSGFTLIEFLVSIVILMVGLLGLLQSVNLAINHNLQNDLRNTAVVVADEELNKLLAAGYDNISAVKFASPPSVQRPVLSTLRNYSVVRVVNQVSSGAAANTRQINVIVSWKHKLFRYTHGASGMLTKNL